MSVSCILRSLFPPQGDSFANTKITATMPGGAASFTVRSYNATGFAVSLTPAPQPITLQALLAGLNKPAATVVANFSLSPLSSIALVSLTITGQFGDTSSCVLTRAEAVLALTSAITLPAALAPIYVESGSLSLSLPLLPSQAGAADTSYISLQGTGRMGQLASARINATFAGATATRVTVALQTLQLPEAVSALQSLLALDDAALAPVLPALRVFPRLARLAIAAAELAVTGMSSARLSARVAYPGAARSVVALEVLAVRVADGSWQLAGGLTLPPFSLSAAFADIAGRPAPADIVQFLPGAAGAWSNLAIAFATADLGYTDLQSLVLAGVDVAAPLAAVLAATAGMVGDASELAGFSGGVLAVARVFKGLKLLASAPAAVSCGASALCAAVSPPSGGSAVFAFDLVRNRVWYR
jgi:hypothetical protein